MLSVVQNPVLLGKKTMRYAAIQMGDANLETQQRGYVPWRSVNVAIESGQIVLEGENEDAMVGVCCAVLCCAMRDVHAVAGGWRACGQIREAEKMEWRVCCECSGLHALCMM